MSSPAAFIAPATLANCGGRRALPGAALQPSKPGLRPGTCGLRAAADPPAGGNAAPDPGAGSAGSSVRAALECAFARDLDAESSSSGGKCTCIWCSGSGERFCAWCKGQGVRKEFLNPSWEQMTRDTAKYIEGEPIKLPEQVPTVCSACSGTRMLRCGYCQGSGVGSYGMGYAPP
jgi:hypothetical protein